jgi:hypothetical protein
MREAVERAAVAARECAGSAVSPLSDADLLACLDGLHATLQQFTVAAAHVVREAEQRKLPAAQHATSTPVWLREHCRVSIHRAKQLVALGRALDRHPNLDTAMADGRVNAEQAQVIADAVADLPADTGPEVAAKAEQMLIGYAGQFEPTSLRKLGARILAHVDPAAADRHDAAALRRQQARAERKRTLALTDTGDGRIRLTGWLDQENGAIIREAVDALCKPLPADDRTPGQRRADALVEVCKLSLHTGSLPDNGGDRPQLVVTVPYDPLTQQLGAGELDTGAKLPPAQVRRLACDAQIIPAVLGGDGEVLDLGRQRRLFTGAARRALILRDGGCSFPGCDRPPRWCDAHHCTSWASGGKTCVANGMLLCGHHHRLVHHGHWIAYIAADGKPEFIPPAYVDPTRTPRRNTFHRRT